MNFTIFVHKHNWKSCDSIPRLLNVQLGIVSKWKFAINIRYFPAYCRSENNSNPYNIDGDIFTFFIQNANFNTFFQCNCIICQ